jgi:hypothetical protein
MTDKRTWTTVQSTQPSSIQRVTGTLGFETELNQISEHLFVYLREVINEFCSEATLIVTMQQAHTDETLMRGVNEQGFIAPDFGKEFHGIYLKRVTFIMIPTPPITKGKKQFLIPYVHRLIKHYFALNPSPYSNWEFNGFYANKPTFPTIRHHAAKAINFPQIVTEVHGASKTHIQQG